MNKIYISCWDRGTRYNEQVLLRNSLLDAFIYIAKKYNPNLEIEFLINSSMHDTLTEYTKNNTIVNVCLDEYNKYSNFQWPLVKLLTVANLKEEEVFHLDFDIIWKYNYTLVFDLLKKKNIDCLYQCYEMLDLPHNYYIDGLRKFPYAQDILARVFNKVAYVAGILYFNKKAKTLLKQFLNTYTTENYDVFGNYCFYEQVLLPNYLISEGINLEVCSNLLNSLPVNEENIKTNNNNNTLFTDSDYEAMLRRGLFLKSLGLYHFLGDIKKKEGFLDYLNYIKDL